MKYKYFEEGWFTFLHKASPIDINAVQTFLQIDTLLYLYYCLLLCIILLYYFLLHSLHTLEWNNSVNKWSKMKIYICLYSDFVLVYIILCLCDTDIGWHRVQVKNFS